MWLTGLNKAANLNGSGGKIIGRRGERFLVALDSFDGPVRLLLRFIFAQVSNLYVLDMQSQEIAVKEENMIFRQSSNGMDSGSSRSGFGLSSLEKQRALHFSLGHSH